MNLPNSISAARIVASPFLAMLPFVQSVWVRFFAFALYLVTAISDHWDGKIARERGLITDLGKILDPMADKLLLPDAGVKGNSHMMMMDQNSDQVAGLIQQWLVKQGVMK